MMKLSFRALLSSLILLFISSALFADVRLPHIIGSNMVLQRDMPIPIWGWADPCEAVTVKFNQYQTSTKADAKGNWRVLLHATKAGGPLEMTIAAKNTIVLKDILIGEVWLCSGQSNMQYGVIGCNNAEKEMAEANYPQIRLLTVPNISAGRPLSDIEASWSPCSPATIPGFSAVAYFFGREVHKKLNVPVGLIHSAWGGTAIEVWTNPEGFNGITTLAYITKQIEQANRDHRKVVADSRPAIDNWLQAARKSLDSNTPLPAEPAWPKHPLQNIGHPVRPTILFNSMINPLVPFAMRGVLWYQGEANVSDGVLYYDKMRALITGWRKIWGQGDFPFYYVQIAPFTYHKLYKADPQALPKLWEAQAVSLAIANTGMAITTDIGDVNNIHPLNKQDVGKRLALWAFAKTYGLQNIVYSGPIYKSMSVEGNKIRVRFDYAGSGLACRDGKPLTPFEIAGADRNFVPAQAKIDGDTLLVCSDAVTAPEAIRFGWSETAAQNLMNKEGLPASPFHGEK